MENLTLEQALEMAERQHPQLAEARAQVEAAAGRAQQAGALPTPELIVGAQQLPLDRDGRTSANTLPESPSRFRWVAGLAKRAKPNSWTVKSAFADLKSPGAICASAFTAPSPRHCIRSRLLKFRARSRGA
ncbi:MAG: TolC family protein [Verrucomicrobia bacterium]|nr:TolC family protein [Verrucomicrobiota bacterium]